MCSFFCFFNVTFDWFVIIFSLQSQSSVVVIHNLKSSRDDGILYPDDQLNDVADDREQVLSFFTFL